MEEDELEMTREELQMWIREKVKKMELISPDVLNKCDVLQSLLIRREEQVTNFLKLCESVRSCEATVKKLYSVLQWEYRERDSGDDDNTAGCGKIPSSPCNSVHSETQVPRRPTSRKRQDSANINEDKCKKSCLSQKRKPVVVLTRLPRCEIDALRPPTPQNQHSEHESSCSHLTSSDVEWKPEDDSADSDNSIPNWTSMAKKRKKIESEPEDDSTDSDHCFPSWTSIAKKKKKKIELQTKDDSTDSSSISTFTRITKKKKKIEREPKDDSTDSSSISTFTRITKKKKREREPKNDSTDSSSISTFTRITKKKKKREREPKNDSTDSSSISTFTRITKKKKKKIEREPKDDSTDSSSISTFTRITNKKRKIEDESSDPDYSVSGTTRKEKKKRKHDKNNRVKTPTSANTDAKSTAMKTPTSANTDAKSTAMKTSNSASTDAKSTAMKTSNSASTDAKSTAMKTPTSANTDAKSTAMKTPTSANTDAKSTAMKTSNSASTDAKSTAVKTLNGKSSSGETSTPKGGSSVCVVSTLCQSTDKDTKTVHNTLHPPSVPQEEITVGMTVLARRRAICWKWGKITEIVEREDNVVKYKVSFEEKGKVLVSGHHIGFQCVPKVTQLFVGSRVVVKCPGDEPKFCPGILSELPTRKNRMRFLVFLDDHASIYVGLPLLHLVCRPLTDPLDDIPDNTLRDFIRDYLKAWPYPPLSQYSVGRPVNIELNGVLKKCEVVQVDSSLIQVVFQEDQHKEWIYRGSTRLEHIISIKEKLKLKKD